MSIKREYKIKTVMSIKREYKFKRLLCQYRESMKSKDCYVNKIKSMKLKTVMPMEIKKEDEIKDCYVRDKMYKCTKRCSGEL